MLRYGCWMVAAFSFLGVLAPVSVMAQEDPSQQLIRMAAGQADSPEFREALVARVGEENLKEGRASVSYGPDFLFATESAQRPTLVIDDEPAGALKQLAGSSIWIHTAKLETGRSHAFYFEVNGEMGRRIDVPAYTPDSYPKPGVPEGALSERITHTSNVYPGMVSDYWIYVSPGYDPVNGAALMVWQDGQGLARRDSSSRLFTVTENLVHEKKIPPMIHVMIAPGTVGERRMRSIEYDAVNDTYTRFLLEEILPEVEKKYKIRADAYSRGIAGQSSGGICAFNAAWQRNDQFSRVLSGIGSFTSIAWRSQDDRGEDVLEGGHFFPFMIRKQPKKNIRVWLQDGSEDLENNHGSWPLQNIQMANSLKMREYDFHLRFGNGQHSSAARDSELPGALTWLWRDYDPSRTEQTYEMDPAEKDKPYFRVKIYNRE